MKAKKIINSTKIIALFIMMLVMNSFVVSATTTTNYIYINGKYYVYYSTNKGNDCIVNVQKTAELNKINKSNPVNSSIDNGCNANITIKSNEYSFNDIVYYCNTSLKESLKINNDVKQKALTLTNGVKADYCKAYYLYYFVSNYIKYDLNRSNLILSQGNTCSMKAGAQYAWDSKTGVCYEYATLFASMANAVGLKVRLIYGENHIWNQVYDEQRKVWFYVDCTWKLFSFDVNKYHKSYTIHAEF